MRSHAKMVLARMMFGGIIGKIGFAGFMVDIEMTLADAIADPEEPHVH